MMYGVRWCVVYGVWCMVYGVWCMVYGVWCMESIVHSIVYYAQYSILCTV